MSRKKHRYRDQQPKDKPVEQAEVIPEATTPRPQSSSPERVTRYKAVIRSPLGEWWHDNKKRVRLFSIIGGAGLLATWLLFELFNLVF